MSKIKITIGDIKLVGELNDTRTAEAIRKALPFQAIVKTWGDEIYFPVPIHLEEEDSREIVEMGDLGYWPDGDAFCIFFGPTPVSCINEIRPASAVNVFGKVTDDLKPLKNIRSGTEVYVALD